ncbi:MAG TPA: cache domain-containing protein, partial [Blastococcus sp.]
MALAAVTVVSLMSGLTGLAVAQSTRAVTDQVTARAHDATAAAQSAVEGRIAVIVQLVSSYAERPDISARVAATDHVVFGPRTALTDALGELHATVPGLVSAWITDERGIIVDTYEHNPATIGQDLSFRDWYQGARRAGAPYLSAGYVNKDPAQTPGFALSVPVRAPGAADGQVVGVLGVSMSLQALEAMFEGAVPNSGRMLITDQAGQVLANPGVPHEPLARNPDDQGVRAALQGRTQLHHGDGWATVSAPLSYGWTVSTSLPMSLADEPNRQLTLTLAVAGVAVVLVLLAALLVLAMVMRQRARAERRLAEALAQVEERRRYTDRVLDTLDVAVAVCDAEGRLTYFNRLSKTWHGMDVDADVAAGDWSDRYAITNLDGTPVDADAWPLIRAIDTGSAVSSELVLRGEDGSGR